MDDPAVDKGEHRRALSGLGRINRVSRTAAALWPPIARIAARRYRGPLSMLDVASGGGDVAVSLGRHAHHAQIALKIQGCDISSTALDYASERAEKAGVPVSFFCLDALSESIPAHYDIITVTLFLHHLSDAQIITLLRKLSAHTDHLLVSDLIRSRTGYVLAWLGTRLLSTSAIVREDGLRSVRAALTLAKARELSAAAGLENAEFERHWPQRFLMHWERRVE